MKRKPHRPSTIQDMFAQIAGRYDLMNTLMTFGRDKTWRKLLVNMVALPQKGRLLDIGSGTGKIAREAAFQNKQGSVVAADFTLKMLKKGRASGRAPRTLWCCADALALPFPDATFDGVTSGYLLRNVSDIRQALREQMRVVKPGGWIGCLETSPPPRQVFRPLVLLYLRWAIPTLGAWVTGQRQAYEYLPETTRRFKSAEELATIMGQVGLEAVRFRRLMFGTVNIHVGRRF